MSPMLDPRELWGDSEISKKMPTDTVFKHKFAYPNVLNKDKQYIFRDVVNTISKVARDHFIKGFLDLDDEWKDHPSLEPYRKQLYEKNPKPFSGYKLFFAKIQIKEIEEEIEDPKTKVKSKQKRICICDKTPYGGKLQLQICVFHNVGLGWTPDWEKPPKIITKRLNKDTGIMENVEEEGNPDEIAKFKPEFKFKSISGFIDKDLMVRVDSFVETFYKKGETLPKELSVLVVAQHPVQNDKYYNIEIGDVL